MRGSTGESYKTSDEFLKDTLASVNTLGAQGRYSNVKVYEFSAEKERPGWKSAAFTSSSASRFIVSFIYCKVTPEYSVKIRATTGDPKNDSLQSFTKAMQELVDHAPKKP